VTLAFGSMHRLNRILIRTKDILGDGDDAIRDENKNSALQYAATFYDLYSGDGSESTYTELGYADSELDGPPALLKKVRACSDPADDVCEDDATTTDTITFGA